MEAIDKFINDNDISMSSINVEERKEGADFFKDSIHFSVVITRGNETPVWSGEYSVGMGHVASWVKTANTPAWIKYSDMPKNLSRMTLHEQETLDRAVRSFKKAAPIQVGDVLISLASDAQNSDQSFSEWAEEMGMSADSISAKRTWEACNDIRRLLEKAFGKDKLEQLYAIANDENPYDLDENSPAP